MPAAEIKQPRPATIGGDERRLPEQPRHGSQPGGEAHPVLGFKWLGAMFQPVPFIIGSLIGFLICCYLGYQTTLKNQYGDIPRFGLFVGPQASFYPTISQFIAVCKSRVTKDQTLVLVGGSSVLNGVGQPNEKLWTKKLQSELGDKYVVVNLALRSCDTYEGAFFVAEALCKQNQRLIFITSAHPNTHWDPMGLNPYAYLFWDAKYHNLLYDFPEREKALADREKSLPDGVWTPESLTELKLSQWLNARFNFLELWDTVGYKYFFTSYRMITDDKSFQPRKRLPNNFEAIETFPMPNEDYAKKYFPSFLASLFKWDAQKKQWVKDSFWTTAEDTIRKNVVPPLRPKTLALLLHMHPGLCRKYESDQELSRDRLAYKTAQEMLQKFGMHALPVCEDYTDEDFRDACHLSPSGGDKLAIETAVEVRKMARQLGYVD